MKHVVMFSYGIASWGAAKLVAQRHGTDNLTLLFTDPMFEDEDTYRWGRAAAANVGGTLIEVADGRDPWQIFFDEQYLGNSRIDPCSKILKRELAAKWLTEHCDPADTTVYVGVHWSEQDRYEEWDDKKQQWKGIKHRYAAMGWRCDAPLCEPPILGYQELHDWATREGLWKQRLYAEGFEHANCGGRCVKQGQAGWERLLKFRRESFIDCENREQAFRDHFGKPVTILREQRGGQRYSLTLREFRERIEANEQCDLFEPQGGCGCFASNSTED